MNKKLPMSVFDLLSDLHSLQDVRLALDTLSIKLRRKVLFK